jgi:O-antigen ligase
VGDAAIERPIAGHGLDSMWKVVPPFGPDAFEPRHAENELLQQFYAYGAFGVILLAGIYGSLWLQMRRLPRSPLRIVFLSILVYILVRGLAEAEPFDLLLPLWSIVTLSLLMESVAQEEAPFQVPDPALGSDTFEPASGTLAAEFAPRA